MIVIKSVEYYEVKEDYCEIEYTGKRYVDIFDRKSKGNRIKELKDVRKEIIKGVAYVSPNGVEVIGCTKEVQDLIGIQYDAWGEMSERLEEANKRADRARNLYIKRDNEFKELINKIEVIANYKFLERFILAMSYLFSNKIKECF